jgi:peptide/nickel transport system substrate-binding protein
LRAPRRARLQFAILLAACAAWSSGCRAPAHGGPESGTLRAVLSSDPASLSLIGKVDANGEIVARLVTDSLIQYDARMQLVPRLAEQWSFSADGRTLTFVLRDGVRWHDGRPLSSADVAFTVGKVFDPATEARTWRARLEALESLDTPDPRTVIARYRHPYADVLDGWTLPILPEHLAGADPELLTSAFSSAPTGCGPFRFVRWERGREIELEANPDYWDGRPGLARIRFRIFPDERTAYQALVRGDLDLLGVTPDLWREAQASTRTARLGRFVQSGLRVWYLGLNQDGSNPYFADPRVRRALVHLLDRDRFVAKVLAGLGRPAAGTFHPDSPWSDPEIHPWRHDPEEARRLLREAGWADRDGDGILDRDGVPFTFTLLMPAGTQEVADRIAAWMQQSLASAGIRMGIEKLEWRAFQERRRVHAFEAAMAAFHLGPTPDQYEIYHSSARQTGFNYVGFSDPESDRLLEAGRLEMDPGRRKEIYHRLQRRLHELEALSALFHFSSPYLHDRRLEGFEPSPLGLWSTAPGPQAWRFAGALQAAR